MNKLNLCVIFGGKSSEHEVSILSATSVLNEIDKSKYNIHIIKIEKSGEWFYLGDGIDGGRGVPAIISPDSTDRGILIFAEGRTEKISIDVIFPILHGKLGEDGTIQGLFELAEIPYVGSGVIGSAVCMDKCVAKILFKSAGIPQADWIELRRAQQYSIAEIGEKLKFPCFIKPSNAGSSVGVSKANSREALACAIDTAFLHDDKVLIEKFINGREVECSVMGNDNPTCADALGEIVPANDFYDYEAKYQDENSKLIIPANVSEDTAEKLKEYAVRAYKICECRGLSRVDFFVEKNTGEIFLNEINTLPGFTSISMYPKMWKASGVEYKDLIDMLINFAIGGRRDG